MNLGKSATRTTIFALAIAAMIFIAGSAKADQIFYFNFSGATVSGSGTLNATDNGDGSFTAVGGTGTQNNGVGPATLSLMFNPDGRNTSPSPSLIFAFDNQLFPKINPFISDAGLLFSTSSQEVNLFSNINGGYNYVQQDGFTESITFSLSDSAPVTIPEPGSVVLLSISMLCFAATRRKMLGQSL